MSCFGFSIFPQCISLTQNLCVEIANSEVMCTEMEAYSFAAMPLTYTFTIGFIAMPTTHGTGINKWLHFHGGHSSV